MATVAEGEDRAHERRRGASPGQPLPGPHPPLPARRDRDVDAQVAGHGPPDERQVALRHLVPLEEGAEAPVDVGAAREQQHAARAPVEAVDHPERPEERLRLLPDGPLGRAAPRDDDAPRRLRHRDEVRVGEEDREDHMTRRTGQISTGPKRESCFSMGPAGPTARTTPSSRGRWRAVASLASSRVTDRMRSWYPVISATS